MSRKQIVRFPGLLRDDKESVERRRWYEEMEKPILESIHKRNEVYRNALDINGENNSENKTPTIVPLVPQPKPPLRYLSRLGEERKESVAAVVCFHGVGSHPGVFAPLCEQLQATNDGVDVFAICLAGRMNRLRDPLTKSWKQLLFDLREEFAAERLSLPKSAFPSTTSCSTETRAGDSSVERYRHVVLVGHCVGALLAYELCRLFSFENRTVSLLISIASRSPIRQSKHNFGTSNFRIPKIEKTEEEEEHVILHQATDKELLRWIVTNNTISQRFAERRDLVRKCLPSLRNDLCLLETYHVQQPYLPGHSFTVVADETRADQMDKDDLEELLDMPPSLFKISLPTVSIHAERDAFVTAADVEAWKFSSSVEHIHFEAPGASHFSMHEEAVLSLLSNSVQRIISSDND